MAISVPPEAHLGWKVAKNSCCRWTVAIAFRSAPHPWHSCTMTTAWRRSRSEKMRIFLAGRCEPRAQEAKRPRAFQEATCSDLPLRKSIRMVLRRAPSLPSTSSGSSGRLNLHLLGGLAGCHRELLEGEAWGGAQDHEGVAIPLEEGDAGPCALLLDADGRPRAVREGPEDGGQLLLLEQPLDSRPSWGELLARLPLLDGPGPLAADLVVPLSGRGPTRRRT